MISQIRDIKWYSHSFISSNLNYYFKTSVWGWGESREEPDYKAAIVLVSNLTCSSSSPTNTSTCFFEKEEEGFHGQILLKMLGDYTRG